MEQNTLKSIKVKLGKKFIIAWILVGIMLIGSIASSLIYVGVQFDNYTEIQDKIVELVLATSDEYDEYENDREKFCDRLYSDLNPGSYYSYFGVSSSTLNDVKQSARQLDNSICNALELFGYEVDNASFYLEYTDYSDYYFYKIFSSFYGIHIWEIFKYLILFSFSLCIILMIINIFYVLDRKTSLSVQDDLVIVKKRTGKTAQFKLKDISSIESTVFKGLKIKGNAIKSKVILLKNADELKTEITQLISDLSSKNQDLSDQHLNETETIKQYKDLLDSGAITQEEFEAKKKQLLGL